MFITPTDNALNKLEDELYNTTPSNGYGVMLKTDEKLGKYLAGPNGMTLYVTSEENCANECLNTWAPYIVGSPVQGESGALGTIKRGNAYQQTYNKIPLYYYRGDLEVGDIKGHNVGGIWFVTRP
jgi:predicted lipoprotein with Yx(FWY)xxD motif